MRDVAEAQRWDTMTRLMTLVLLPALTRLIFVRPHFLVLEVAMLLCYYAAKLQSRPKKNSYQKLFAILAAVAICPQRFVVTVVMRVVYQVYTKAKKTRGGGATTFSMWQSVGQPNKQTNEQKTNRPHKNT